eukprot:CAMPEP_0178400772 /NCGR_PEP_ID=MMETSP0689_2-20121128/15960_1 /TAXON_ID=160604 /ORGANISM="Amphidinium massartii, Strain CS-259" /LENGTH=774 /DNA_ID=CAMNT_0020021575 /DNA_START=392 /DNA_END=2716 /DNA_ORIENTATION=+
MSHTPTMPVPTVTMQSPASPPYRNVPATMAAPCSACGGVKGACSTALGGTLAIATTPSLVPMPVQTTTTKTYAPQTTYQVHPPQPLQQVPTTLPARRSRSAQQASPADLALYQTAHQAWSQHPQSQLGPHAQEQVNNSQQGGRGGMSNALTQTGDFERSMNNSGLPQESYIIVEKGAELPSPAVSASVDTEMGPSASFARGHETSHPASEIASETTDLNPRTAPSTADMIAAAEAARSELNDAAERGMPEALLGALPAAIDARVTADRIEAARFRCAEAESQHWEARAAESAQSLLQEAMNSGNLEHLTAATRRAQEAGVSAESIARAKGELDKLQHRRHAEEALLTQLKASTTASTERRTASLAEAIANAADVGVGQDLINHSRKQLEALEQAEEKQRGAVHAERAMLACAERGDANPSSLAEAIEVAMDAGADLRSTSRATEKKMQLTRQEFCDRRSEMGAELLSRAVREATSVRELRMAAQYAHSLGAPEELLQRAERKRQELEEATYLTGVGGLSTVELAADMTGDIYSPFSPDCRASTMTLPPEGRRQTYPMEAFSAPSSRKSLPLDNDKDVRRAPQSNWEPTDDLPMYGLDRDLQEEQSRKYDTDAEKKAAAWVEEITGYHVTGNFGPSLRTGQVLCELVNRIKPGQIPKINEAGAPWKERENLNKFLAACRQLGVHEYALFSTNDLYDGKNLGAVVRCVHALGGAVQVSVPEFAGPHLGVADTSKAKVDKRRELGVASQTAGFHQVMERSQLDTVSNQIVRSHHGGS